MEHTMYSDSDKSVACSASLTVIYVHVSPGT